MSRVLPRRTFPEVGRDRAAGKLTNRTSGRTFLTSPAQVVLFSLDFRFVLTSRFLTLAG
jgi:hypothetical protein